MQQEIFSSFQKNNYVTMYFTNKKHWKQFEEFIEDMKYYSKVLDNLKYEMTSSKKKKKC